MSLELIVAKIGEGGIRVSLFENARFASSIYSLATLRDPQSQEQVAAYLVRQVRPQAGAHEALRVAEMIGRHVEKF